MIIKILYHLIQEEIESLISNVAFFQTLKELDYDQYMQLRGLTQVIDLAPKDIIIKKGTVDENFYSLVSGTLNVYASSIDDKPVGYITKGQVIGALSLINKQPRTATLAASNFAPAKILATEFALFGELDDFSEDFLAILEGAFVQDVEGIEKPDVLHLSPYLTDISILDVCARYAAPDVGKHVWR